MALATDGDPAYPATRSSPTSPAGSSTVVPFITTQGFSAKSSPTVTRRARSLTSANVAASKTRDSPGRLSSLDGNTGGHGATAGPFERAGSLARISKGGSTARTAAASLVLSGGAIGTGSPQRAPSGILTPLHMTEPIVLRIYVASAMEGVGPGIKASVDGAKLAEGSKKLPDHLQAGDSVTATYVSSTPFARGSGTKGTVRIENFEPVPFAIGMPRQNDKISYIGLVGHSRYTALQAERWDWRNAGDKPTEGKAADMELRGTWLSIHLRLATPTELKRCLQLQALREAIAGDEYDTLHAQVTKATNDGVEFEELQRGEQRLKELRKMRLHVAKGCDRETVRDAFQWSKVTNRSTSPEPEDRLCPASADCECNSKDRLSEVLLVVPSAIQDVLGPGTDKELFEELVGAALASEEGCVWKAGGKFIFSAFTRNQSSQALLRHLETGGKHRCASMFRDLMKHSEKVYGGFVLSVQINFHHDGSTYHDAHRDIYSAKQRAGMNCTCTFRACNGTVCYSVGSSRICTLETQTDSFSELEPCCDNCEGRKFAHWLHSGTAIYFNEPFNKNHLHGIPKLEGACGPRISIAFLMGALEEELKAGKAKVPLAVRSKDLEAAVDKGACPLAGGGCPLLRPGAGALEVREVVEEKKALEVSLEKGKEDDSSNVGATVDETRLHDAKETEAATESDKDALTPSTRTSSSCEADG